MAVASWLGMRPLPPHRLCAQRAGVEHHRMACASAQKAVSRRQENTGLTSGRSRRGLPIRFRLSG